MSKRTLLTAAVVAAVFLAGAVAGAAVMRLASPGAPSASILGGDREGFRGSPEGRGDRDGRRNPVYALTRLLDEELDLAADQRERVREILERRSQDARQIFRESRERFRAHLDSTVEELTGVLSGEQAREFRDLIEEMRDRKPGPPGRGFRD